MIVLFVVRSTDKTSHQNKFSTKTPVRCLLVHHCLSRRCFPRKLWEHLTHSGNSYCLENLQAGVSQSSMNETAKSVLQSLYKSLLLL